MTCSRPIGRSRLFFLWIIYSVGVFGIFGLAVPGFAEEPGLCTVAREIATKGVGRFDSQRNLGLAAIRRAHDLCSSDLGIAFNLGLAWYLDKQLPKARETWETLYKTTRDFPVTDRLALKVLTNLAWLRFEMGDDEAAHLLSFEGFRQHPGNLALAHTKFMSLMRMARYLEAYDWLSREKLPGSLPLEWKNQTAEYMVESLWREFRSGKHLSSIKNAVDFYIKEYPEEPIFIRAKEQLLVAEVDPKGEIPPLVEMPDSSWPKSGNIDDRVLELDGLLASQPELEQWKKREDAFAVVVGIARYRNIESRHYGDRDAANMASLLTRRGVFLADQEHTRLRVDDQATQEAILQDIEWLAQKGRVHPNAVLLFYFSGLGAPWIAHNPPEFVDGLLLPFQVDGLNINPQTAISLNLLKGMLSDLPDRDISVILDTCFHGQGHCGTRLLGKRALPTKAFFNDTRGWAISSVQGDAGVLDAARQGAFTYQLLKGFLGQADGADGLGRDGWVNLSEAFGFAQAQLRKLKPTVDGVLTAPATIRLTRTRGEE